MHFAGAGIAHHADDLLRGGAAHQRVVDQDDALALDRGAVGRMLHAHAEFAHALGRLDEGAADVMVSDDAEFERHAGMLAVAEGGGHAGVRHRHHDVDFDMALARELRAEGLADVVDRAAADDGIRPREIDVFEDAGPRRLRRERLWLCAPASSNTMISPGSMSRTYLAPIMSSAQVSEVRIGRPSRSPSTSGRMPSGSRRRSASCWSARPARRRLRSRAAPR